MPDPDFGTQLPSHGPGPLLSIVTILYNAREGLLETAESLVGKMPDWCEWVVVDGGSSDGSYDEIKRLTPHIACWVSEPDKGIADAFNKGARMSMGRYVLFLNAGDRARPGMFDTLASLLAADPAPVAIIGRIRMSNRLTGHRVSFRRQLWRNYLPHQATLIRRDLFNRLGFYDESYRLGMDYEWSLRLRDDWDGVRFIDATLAEMEPGGISMTNYRKTFAAYHRARMKHGHSWAMSKIFEHYFVLKVRFGRLLRRSVLRRG